MKEQNIALKLAYPVDYVHHRSGWRFALAALKPLFAEEGILFDSHLDSSFGGRFEENIASGKIPYQEPWIGIFHNPPGAPPWTPIRFSQEEILKLPTFQASLAHCKGLFTLSEAHAAYLRSTTALPVEVLYHPTELEVPPFDLTTFRQNSLKKVIQIGTWLRKLNSIHALPLEKGMYRKVQLVPAGRNFTVFNSIRQLEAEREEVKIEEKSLQNTFALSYVNHQAYDELLRKNIAFLDLHAASANNAIIECIARATPVLVNRLPATEEYLGEAYPFFFQSLEEAAEKARDMALIEQTHHYLMAWKMREKLSAQHFYDSFTTSKIYRQLEVFSHE